ncbi:hypothetical protein COT47_05280 [Candidatus Woesearchaeota archaeon CG08_land_8_20_14_0_20_43_7]|nr:MAG: hypothetical protein COT47_05280 [Candidatus Woesearchaeota archaeon CG08_land_8_20_14_0_20_43_7]
MVSLKRYKVIICPSCGLVQSSGAAEVFKCLKCGKSRKILSKTHVGFNVTVLDSFDNPRQATLFVQEYNKQRHK